MNKNEPSIRSIKNNDTIIIIEHRNFPDDSYYNSLFERKRKKNIVFSFLEGNKYNMVLSEDIKISEIYKTFSLNFRIDNYCFSLRFIEHKNLKK